MTKKSINGIISDMTAEEQTQFEQDQTRVNEVIASQEAEKTNKENLKASAKAKLIAGEALTEEEANVMIGG